MTDEASSGAGYPAGSLMRQIVALAIRSGISPTAWLAEPPDVLETAFELLREEAAEAERIASQGGRTSPRARDPRLSSETSDRGR